MISRPIAISLSPNTQKDDVILALKLILQFWKWNDEAKVRQLEKEFAAYFGKQYLALALNSGRSALSTILKATNIGRGDEVILQAFTCTAVPNPIIWNRATPVFADVDKNLNIDIDSAGERISEKTKSIIVQHTFGVPLDFDQFSSLAEKHNLLLIEDCAHALGATYRGKMVGTLGDAAFFSFGRDKVISSVFGGMVLTQNKELYHKMKNIRDTLPTPSRLWIFRQLFHPIIFSIILPLYNVGLTRYSLGKLILFTVMKLGLITKPVSKLEERGVQPHDYPGKFPGALAFLALNQLKKLSEYNKHREKITSLYFERIKNNKIKLPEKIEGAIWLRFPIRVENAENLFIHLKGKKILIGNWYSKVIMPSKDEKIFSYIKGSCPMAEAASKSILNLPTYPTFSEKQASQLITILNSWKE